MIKVDDTNIWMDEMMERLGETRDIQAKKLKPEKAELRFQSKK